MRHNHTPASLPRVSELRKLLENWAELQSPKQAANVENVCVLGREGNHGLLVLQKEKCKGEELVASVLGKFAIYRSSQANTQIFLIQDKLVLPGDIASCDG